MGFGDSLRAAEDREGWKVVVALVWFDFCITALQHILGHFGRGQLH